MGKGANRRKRQKLAVAARDGNLVQAQWGKASASLKPPRAPTEQDYKEKIPASLRRVMAAKALAAEQEEKKRAKAQQRSGQAAGLASRVSEGGTAQHQQAQQPQQPQQPQQHEQQAKRRKQKGEDQGSSEPSTSGQGGNQEARFTPAKAQPASAAAASAKVYKLNAFDQQPQKKGKEKKKAYQEKREAKKKAQKLKHKPEATMTPAELALVARERLTQAGFGETATAPLKVNLKRKHWTGDQGERLAKIQKEQLSRAEKAAPHAASQPKPKAAAAPPAGGGLLHQARQQQAAADKEYAREAVIEAYRQQKKQGTGGGATMASLGKLVAAGAERMRQEQQS